MHSKALFMLVGVRLCAPLTWFMASREVLGWENVNKRGRGRGRGLMIEALLHKYLLTYICIR